MLTKILEKLQCKTLIIDFDYTITKKKSHTSIGVFGDLFDVSIKDKKQINGKADNSKNPIYMKYHWKKKIQLLKKYGADSLLEEASNLFYVNLKFKELLDYCKESKIRIIILSSGYKPLIEYILDKYDIKYDELYASDDNIVITPISKKKILKKKYEDAVVIGDNIHDSKMYKHAIYKIGVCHDILEFERMKKHFDYVTLENVKAITKHNGPKGSVGILGNEYKMYFYKEKNSNTVNEVEGYNCLKEFYKTSKLCIETENYIIYEYIPDFHSSTLNDYFYGTEERIVMPLILNSYKKAMRNSMVLIDEKDTKTNKFFKGRIERVEETLNSLEYEKIIIGEKNYEIKPILKDVIKEIKKEREVHAFLTNGAPTDRNITTTGYITDFENAGYNSVISEIVILFVSLFTHGSYFYPKYNEQEFLQNIASLKTYNAFKPNLKYKTIKDTVYISEYDFKINSKNKRVLLEFLEMYLTSPYYENYKSEFKYLKHYIIARILTPITLEQMSGYDAVSILTLIIVVNKEINDLKSLINFINKLDEIKL